MTRKKELLIVVPLILILGFVLLKVLVLDKSPASAPDPYAEAIRLIEANKLDQAEALLNKAIEEKPEEGKYEFAMGNLFRQKNDRDKALIHYEKAIRESPQITESYNNLAGIHMVNNQLDKALTVIGQGLKQDPGFKDLLFKKGQILYVYKQYQEAITTLEPIKNDKENVEAYRFIGLSYLQLQQTDQAAAQLKIYSEKAPSNAAAKKEVETIVAQLAKKQ